MFFFNPFTHKDDTIGQKVSHAHISILPQRNSILKNGPQLPQQEFYSTIENSLLLPFCNENEVLKKENHEWIFYLFSMFRKKMFSE